MSKIFVNMGISLDGYVAGPNRSIQNPMGDGAHSIHSWIFAQRAFRQHLHIDEGGETGADNAIVEHTFQRIGANVMGKRMFDEGEAAWPEEAPFGVPVFVVTKEVRAPWVRPGGTTFYFVNDGLESALARARAAAGKKDVRISGGRAMVVQSLNAGVVEDLELALAPVLLGDGLRLFEGVDKTRVSFELTETIASTRVTHLRYRVKMVG